MSVRDEFLADSRQFYYYLLNIETYTPLLMVIWQQLIQQLSVVYENDEDLKLSSLLNIDADNNMIEHLVAFRDRIIEPFKKRVSPLFSNDIQQYLIKQYAPFYRIDGCWLCGNISLKDSCHEYGAALLKSHSEIVGNGNVEKSHSYLFEQYAASKKIKFLPVFSKTFIEDVTIEDYAFQLPVFLLSLSQYPTKLLPEILGANLLIALMNYPILMPSDSIMPTPFANAKETSTNVLIKNAMKAIYTYIELSSKNNKNVIINKIEQGFFVTLMMYKNFYDKLTLSMSDKNLFSINAKMLAIVEKIGSKAYGYHKKGKMNGKPIDVWFDPDHFDAKDTLFALANSTYIQPGKPESSRFLTYITSPKGPMFRVFSDEEINIIKLWISELGKNKFAQLNHLNKAQSKAHKKTKILSKADVLKISTPFLDKYKRCTLQELYYYLLNIDEYLDAYAVAKHYAARWLAKHKLRLFSGACSIPFKIYSHKKLDRWLEKQHQKQVTSYIPLTGCPNESKDSIIHEAIRLVPLTYIDGAWVRKSVLPHIVTTDVGSRLYHIYVDELGNGDTRLHHGNIYRSLMNEMKVDLPAFTTSEFPCSKYFTKNDLRVPVFWLSISLFPRTYLPEILGLNLAMELSGIGGEYRRAGDILKYYGFSAQFTKLHNTIDNIVTGHTAWALEAIKIHLDELYQKGGTRMVQDHWYRIWTGYRSLIPPKEFCLHSIISIINLICRKKTQEVPHVL